ncbi:bifunctional proline dehydrogenase/L-glutamate gamma-semialdehyde dehydrogenase [Bythopirellula goksoeyrii]|uniref:L-glutamate gamma-semialdehyde dehydrogenase n=1 Tax=Bythopirellula goksoeyrii TaxID=1400387 RepID=A0A5B9QGP8_9BACT|nr:bifunctional proline dehydrogenase/L-glutamate gamma-semialdehyde dehydrogenase [Bythopirellula goksoeyrii]QEG37964.1 1-pyrroline-5-carboxylate dehydrogenase 1 [Bythopirellula goksoeyrii]
MSQTLSSQTAAEVANRVAALLADFSPDADSPFPVEVQQALFLARQLQLEATALQTPEERRQQAELDRMMQSPGDKTTLMQITDQSFRSRLPHRAADQMIHILDVQGVPRFFSTLDRTLLKGFQSFGAYLPSVSMPFVKEKMQHETANVILPAEEELLSDYLRQRREVGLRMNVNFLGEALLGEEEAERRLQSYLAALQRPELEVLSIKISTIYSQISPLAREHTVSVLCDRLELLLRAATKYQFERHDGTRVPKFVYLDMEEYRDMTLTAEVFMRTLDREGLQQARAGIALQGYIPDSFAMQQEITAWARERHSNGGAPVTIRLVKGANMEMERVEASLHGWPQAPFQDKLDTDANYHRMLQFGIQPENLAAVHLGIASHNLFTLAYGLVLATQAQALDKVQFEMLEGMANHQRRALFDLTQNVLLYAPACRQEEFINAIGYLVRRLDENTGEENFLRHAFRLSVDSPDWQHLAEGFAASFARIESLPNKSRRTQDRSQPSSARPMSPVPRPPFSNEPDTDWCLPHNDAWGQGILAAWKTKCDTHAIEIPLVVGGKEVTADRDRRDSHDPSRARVVVARYSQANAEDAAKAVECANSDPAGWRSLSPDERTTILDRVADTLSTRRGDLMGAMLAEGGKLLTESDPEVSEAIDFCRFYSRSAAEFYGLSEIEAKGRGVVVVVSPWNFPLAIPCGGVAAALAAGNTVILKPASDTVLIAYLLCECFWSAGVPRTALQLLPCSGGTVGQQLVTHEGVNAVILTGGTETALRMLAAKPSMNLLAETGGKNATIVTALADRDLAIKHVLHSAFSHSGQKCSATSLLILESEVYHDSSFRKLLVDAVESLEVGSAWELPTKIGPLIRPPSGELERGLKELEPGESWAVMPRLHVDDNPHLVGPGVKWGVQPGSVTHMTEFFGPLLGVMEARDLHDAIDMVNATGYGLTSGLESLDDREHQLWQEGIRAGNLYINRSTTGAIVLRQPFGGMGKSAVGPGIKAGGPNYVAQFMKFKPNSSSRDSTHRRSETQQDLGDTGLDDFCEALRMAATRDAISMDECEQIVGAAQSYEYWMAQEFDHAHDHFQLVGEDNFRRYLPLPEVRLRIHPDDSPLEIFARALASRTAGCRTVVSSPPGLDSPLVTLLDDLTDSWAGTIEFIVESDEELAQALREGHVNRLRFANPDCVPYHLRTAAALNGDYLADTPVSTHGRVELLWYFQEQSLSHLYHRYGNLGSRSEEERAAVL